MSAGHSVLALDTCTLLWRSELTGPMGQLKLQEGLGRRLLRGPWQVVMEPDRHS